MSEDLKTDDVKLESFSILTKKNFARPLGGVAPLVYASAVTLVSLVSVNKYISVWAVTSSDARVHE